MQQARVKQKIDTLLTIDKSLNIMCKLPLKEQALWADRAK